METLHHILGIACYTLGIVYYTTLLIKLWRNRQKASAPTGLYRLVACAIRFSNLLYYRHFRAICQGTGVRTTSKIGIVTQPLQRLLQDFPGANDVSFLRAKVADGEAQGIAPVQFCV